MANKTTNYGLTKPLQGEFYDVNVPNSNMDIIDTELKRVDSKVNEVDTSLQTVIPHVERKDNPHGVTAEQVGLVPLAELANLYVWKKYEDNPSYVESTVDKRAIGVITTSTNNCNITYASEVSVTNGTISLVNPTSTKITNATVSSFDVVKGKYLDDGSGGIIYVYPSSTITISSGTYVSTVYATEASIITAGERTPLGLVSSNEIGAYPNNGQHTDGYWYEYQSKLGEKPYTYGTEDLTSGESELETGKLYFVYE